MMHLKVQITTTFIVLMTTGIFAVGQETDTPSSGQRADILVADFEAQTYGDWKVEGEAFGPGPAEGTLNRQMQVSGYKGKRLVNTFFGGDAATGTLTSPPLKIERHYLTFLVGGGAHEGKTCMNLLLEGKVVRSITGANDRPGGSEALELAVWDVRDLQQQTVQIQIVDAATRGWGHVNVDHIVQTDTRPKVTMLVRRERTFSVANKYLIIPIQNKGGRRGGGGRLQLYIDGEEVRDYGLNLAPSPQLTDWYAFFTINSYLGQEARVVASKATEEGFALVKQSDTIPGEENFYKEDHRPQFHFTQKVGWNNDPNGMVYHDGKWHLFFQHNPVALPWGNMTWGHATSEDLLHWKQQPNKLFPKTMAVRDCFSGGATVDKNNTAGWGKNTLVAFFTDTGCGECIAYSTDGGENFTYYKNNPVVKHKGRDPKVIWYEYKNDEEALNEEALELGGHWVMVVFDDNKDHGGRNAAFYTSTNMKQWTEQSHLPGYYECTELFELPVDGDKSTARWVVFAADAKYAVGSFDGKSFTPDHEGKHQLHWGPYYASQTFDNAPDGRRIQMGWLRVVSPGPYNQHFSFPHRLTLRTTTDGVRLFAKPIKEIEDLRARSNRAQAQDLIAGQPVTLSAGSDLLDVRLTVDVGNASMVVLKLAGRSIRYDVKAQKLNGSPLKPVDGRISIQVLADRSLTEIIGNDGRVFISGSGPAKLDATGVSVVAEGGNAKLITLEAHELKSIW